MAASSAAPRVHLTDRVHHLLRGTLNASALTTSTMVLGMPMMALGVLGVLRPDQRLDAAAIAVTNRWLANNRWLIEHALPNIEWRLSLPDDLNPEGQYLLVCNHQSWVDTTLMQYISLNRLPLTRFFTKAELVYIPILGLSFKMLGFPMMKRHSKEALAKNPALRQQDFDEARRSCEKLTEKPYTLLNYLEGTRFTAAKHAEQQSPYTHLLKPKAGGLGLALNILGQQIDGLLDMTIVYPDGVPGYADFWMGRVRRIGVDIRKVAVPDDLKGGDYERDPAYRKRLTAWINGLWAEKDQKIRDMLVEFGRDPDRHPPALSP